MFNLKRFLLLGSLGLTLVVGLMFTAVTSGSHIASAAGCNNPVTGSWSTNSCLIGEGSANSNDVVAIQEIITFSNTSFNGQSCDAMVMGVDGSFGTHTSNAVKCFQGAKGLSQDGVVGTNTWRALQGVVSPHCTTVSPNQPTNCSLPANHPNPQIRFIGADAGTGVWEVWVPAA